MNVDNLVSGFTAVSALSILVMAVINITREKVSFTAVLAHLGSQHSRQADSKHGKNLHSHDGSKSKSGNKEQKQLDLEYSESSKSPATAEMFRFSSISTTAGRISTSLSPKLDSSGPIPGGTLKKVSDASDHGQRRSKIECKKGVSNAAIYTAFQNRAVVLACIFGIISAIDPLGRRNILGLPVFMALLFAQIFSGYLIQCFWCFSWISFLVDFHKLDFKIFIKLLFAMLAFVNTAATVLVSVFFQFRHFRIPFAVSLYTLSIDWVLSTILFSYICTYTAKKAISHLEEGKFSKANRVNIENLKRKMVSANFSFISAMLVSAIPLMLNFPQSIALEGNDPPTWYYFGLMIILPQGWAFILAFNWIWKIEVVSVETPMVDGLSR